VGFFLAERRSQGVEAAAKLDDLARRDPPRQLPPDIGRIHVAGKEQTGLEERLISDNPEKFAQLHGSKLP
jgi:hypothetical protein